MSKKHAVTLSLCLAMGISSAVYAQDTTVKVNEKECEEETIENINGTLMISADDFANMFLGTVSESEKNCSISWGNEKIVFIEGNDIAEVGFGDYKKDYHDIKISNKVYKNEDGRFMIPLRSTVENFIKTDIVWNDAERCAEITIPKTYEVISEEDSAKMKDKKIDKIEIEFEKISHDEINLEITNEKEIKKAVDLFDSLLSYKVPNCRCQPIDVLYKVSYSDGEKQEIKISGVKDYFKIFDDILPKN